MNNYKHEENRRRVAIGGGIILTAITLLSCVSSFVIFSAGFGDFPAWMQTTLGIIAVSALEGCFIWLLYGFKTAFSSFLERMLCLGGMGMIVACMLVNLMTHFQMAKGVALADWQTAWVDYAGVSVLIAVLLLVLCITLSDPVVRLLRLELRYIGRQAETVLKAKTTALRSDRILEAMSVRADQEAEVLAEAIEGESDRKQIGFASADEDEEPRRGAGFLASAVTMEKPPTATRGRNIKIKSTAKRPAAPNGYEFRGNSSGFELRRIEWVDGKRKRPYVAHLGKEEYAEMRRQNRGGKLDAAIQQWVAEHDR